MSKNNIMQYTVEFAYLDNYVVTRYANGERIGSRILAYCELDGYTEYLEDQGYTKAYDVEKVMEEYFEALEQLKTCVARLENAMKNQLYLKNK